MTYSQASQPIRIKTALGETTLLLTYFTGSEEISEPFEYTVTMASDNDAIDLASLIGTPATVTLQLSTDKQRYFSGWFRNVEQHQKRADGLIEYEGILVPWLWFLHLSADCRIFQTKTVTEIISAVFDDAGFTDYSDETTTQFDARDYCVQYQESHFNFVSRLMEEEGIFYFFRHTEGKHTLVLADAKQSYQECPDQSNADYRPSSGDEVSNTVHSIVLAGSAFTQKTINTNYNFTTPSLTIQAEQSEGSQYSVAEYTSKYETASDAERYAKLRLDGLTEMQSIIKGAGNVRSFSSGYTFTLQAHYRSSLNGKHLLLSVTHTADATEYNSASGTGFAYSNTFEAIPASVLFRPERKALKPRIDGVQTAAVVGPAGEEIYVDSYGRVKVQFYWDRVGTQDENSSCWVRVSQIWAGQQWGWISNPRIGQEVVISFVEGDPDRPLITGRVYNGEQTVPYTLPANKTQTGIQSRSSLQGSADNYNEIQFEDKKGFECISVHAEKDMITFVENDDTQTVQNNRSIEVDGTHTEKIQKDTAITITEGNHSLTLNQGNQSITLDQGNQATSIKEGNQSTTLDMGNQSTELKMGDETYKLDLGKSEKEAMVSIELKVGQNSIKIDQSGITLQGLMIKVQGQIQVQVAAPMTQVNGDGLLQLKGGITMIN